MKNLIIILVALMMSSNCVAQFSYYKIQFQNSLFSIQKLSDDSQDGYVVSLPENEISEFLLYGKREPIKKVSFESVIDVNGQLVQKYELLSEEALYYKSYEINKNNDAFDGSVYYYNYPISISGILPTNNFVLKDGIYILEFYSNNNFIESNFIKVEQNILIKL
jgi:hypothetical protein